MAGAFEARVPTRLIDRSELLGDKREVRLIANGVEALFRVGPYDVIRGVVRAPAAWLVEARGPSGEAVLLQLSQLRTADDETEIVQRINLERRVAKATAALFVESDLPILAHGGTDRDDGSRVLFWAMPWRSDVERLSTPGMYVEGTTHLLRIAVALTMRLATRHVLGGLEPLLHENMVVVSPEGADLVGVPVHVSSTWLAEQMPASHAAPEELPEGQPTKAGDLWRLGHTLIALAPDFDDLPQELRALLHALSATDPERRPARATEVLAELEAVHARIAPHEPPLSARSASSTVPMMTRADRINDPVIVHAGDSPTMQHLPSTSARERDDDPTLDCGPPWAFFLDADEFALFLENVRADLERRELEYVFGTGVVQLATPDGSAFRYTGLTDLARTCHRAPRSSWVQAIRADFDRLLEATAKDPDVGTPVDFDVEPAPLASGHTAEESLDGVLVEPLPIIVGDRLSAKAEPNLPFPIEGEEETLAGDPPAPPIDETSVTGRRAKKNDVADLRVTIGRRASSTASTALLTDTNGAPAARPTAPLDDADTKHLRDRRFADELPTLALRTVDKPPTLAPLIDGSGTPTLGPELRAVASNGFARVATAVFVTLLAVGAGVLGWQQRDRILALLDDTPLSSKSYVATSANAVRIDATPATALVVSERDGRILGRAPIKTIVPPGAEVAVLVAAPGHEPQRIVLPNSGVVEARLVALPEDVKPCALDLAADARERFEGVGANLVVGNRLAVRGAAVVRAREDSGQTGAWLVRCPSFGGGDHIELTRPATRSASITIAEPRGAAVYLDEVPVGEAPVTAKIRGAFTRVSIARGALRHQVWIPTLHDTSFALPFPHDAAEARSN